MESANRGPVSDSERRSRGRVESIQDWLRRRGDTALGRLALNGSAAISRQAVTRGVL